MASNEVELSSVHEGSQKSSRSSSRVSMIASKVNDTVLDHIVGRFSFVNDHQVRGKWRTVLSFAIVSVPAAVFGVMIWVQTYEMCNGKTAVFPILPADQFLTYEDSMTSFMSADSIHYCFSVYTLSNVSPYFCRLDDPYSHYSGDGYCRMFHDVVFSTNQTLFDKCMQSAGQITIYYSECVPATTALVTAQQCALYAEKQ
eukprot:GDKK01017301.1.p1 GENE.GDKK01017301.1~~GDKK01017301.1.p1  ORF type:complete len:200 (-),score=0.48 GDKK01017301.1:11-610(-)